MVFADSLADVWAFWADLCPRGCVSIGRSGLCRRCRRCCGPGLCPEESIVSGMLIVICLLSAEKFAWNGGIIPTCA